MLKIFGALAIFVALTIIRSSLVQFLGLDGSQVWAMGLAGGLLTDFAFSFIPLAVGSCFAVVHPRLRHISIFLVIVLWLGVFANASYFKFFRAQLDLWVLTGQSDQAWSIRKIIVQLFANTAAVASLSFAVLSIALHSRIRPSTRLKSFVFGVVLLTAALCLRKSQEWMEFEKVPSSVVFENIFHRWSNEIEDHGWDAFKHVSGYHDVASTAPSWLRGYAEMGFGTVVPRSAARLSYLFESPSGHTENLKARLGFAPHQSLNVVLMFLESARAFEYLDPVLGPETFPNLRQVLNEKGLFFDEAYSSAQITVNGQYGTLCSALSRQEGLPVYIEYPYINIKCLPSLFVDGGYRTYWMNPFDRFYGGKFIFESNHGTQTFIDRPEFTAENADEAINSNDFGISDRVFYRKAFRQLEKIHAKKEPFFAHLLNVGTHGPWSGEFEDVSPELSEKLRAAPDHHGYVKTAKALDRALGRFFKTFFASPMADDTVVMLISDHGHNAIPAYPQIGPSQRNVIGSRILFGVVSKNMRKPETISYPVNQMDMAPLIASVAGLRGRVSWLGRDPTLGSGTPWVVERGGLLSFRSADHYCAELPESPRMECWKMTLQADPLMAPMQPGLEVTPELANDFRNIVRSNELLTEIGKLMDPDGIVSYDPDSEVSP